MLLLFLSANAALAFGNPPALDSLLNEWRNEKRTVEERLFAFNEAYTAYYQQFPDTMLQELDELARKALEWNHPMALFEAWIRKGGLLNYQGKNEAALVAYDRAEEVIRPIGDQMRLGSLANNRGNVYAQQADFAKAMAHFNEALELHSAAGYQRGQWNARMALGNVFVLIETYELGKVQYESVLAELDWQPENARFRGLLYMNLGYCEYKLEHFDRAGELYEQALPLMQQSGSDFDLASCHQNMAILRKDEERTEEALFHIHESYALFQQLGAQSYEIECQLTLAQILRETDREQAMSIAKQVLSQFDAIESDATKSDLYELLYLGHKDDANLELALAMHEQHLAFHDSVEASRNRYSVIRTAYEKDVEYQMNVIRLEGQKAMDELLIQQLKTVLWLTLTFVLVVSLLIAYTVRTKAAHEQRRQVLLKEINSLKAAQTRNMAMNLTTLEDQRPAIEQSLGRELNETDWRVLKILLDDPTITNQAIADQACLSVDGIGSSLRRMYTYFDVKETKYKKIGLVHAVAQVAAEANGSV